MRTRIATLEDDDDDDLEITTRPVPMRRSSVRLSRPRRMKDLSAFLGVPWWGWVLGAAGVGTIVALVLTRKRDINTMVNPVPLTDAGVFADELPAGVADWAGAILSSAQRYGVSPWALAGILYRESRGGLALTPKGDPGGTGDFTPRSPSHTYFKYANPATGLPPDGLGWGRGLFQIDFGAWNSWVTTNDWRNPQVNIDKGASILADAQRFFSSGAGGAVSVPSWRLQGSQFTDPWPLESLGPYADPRPLSGPALLEAAIAAYNAGAQGVLQAVAAGLSPNAATAGGDYAQAVVNKGEAWASSFYA